jgi:hypothetical protein
VTKALAALATGLLLAGFAAPAYAQQAPVPATSSACQFTLGFKVLHDMDAGDVGDCLDNQAYAPNGDAQQHTTKGLMAWRKADNWTAFTDGYHTWINGPQGLQQRLNTDHFQWESAAPAASPGPSAAPAAAPSAAPAPVATQDPNNPLTPQEIASIAVPDGYPQMADLPVTSQVGCFHMAQDLQAAGTQKVTMQKDDVLCPYADEGIWPGFKQTS